uniref:Gag-pol polyprotein n=1 Tax=Solanum tuberosum TaxID=4113 RepID=M1CUE9_SOLTU
MIYAFEKQVRVLREEKRGEREKFVVVEGLARGFRQGVIPMSYTQVIWISIQCLVDPVEQSESVGSHANRLQGIARLMINLQQVEKNQLKDREEFEHKRARASGNESGQQKSNVNQSSFQHKQKRPAPSSSSAPAPRNKCEYNSQNSHNFRARPAHSQGSKAQGGY